MPKSPTAPTLFDLCREPVVSGAAGFSPCRRYRYWLTRVWDVASPLVCFLMLNPSLADEETDDPTLRRCMGFARAWGAGGVALVNLFAYRTPYPRELLAAPDPVGPENDYWVAECTAGRRVIAAWGSAAHRLGGRDREVLRTLSARTLECLGTTSDGSPRHPLRLRADTVPVPFPGHAAAASVPRGRAISARPTAVPARCRPRRQATEDGRGEEKLADGCIEGIASFRGA